MRLIHRPYRSSDRDACLRLFDGNTPPFFAPSERSDFIRFLERRGADYQVVIACSVVVACGGYLVAEDGVTAGLCWGMVERGRHGRGLGRALLKARLEAIRAARLRRVILDTSQHTAGFYARYGFQAVATIKDGYGPGLDRVDMTLDL